MRPQRAIAASVVARDRGFVGDVDARSAVAAASAGAARSSAARVAVPQHDASRPTPIMRCAVAKPMPPEPPVIDGNPPVEVDAVHASDL